MRGNNCLSRLRERPHQAHTIHGGVLLELGDVLAGLLNRIDGVMRLRRMIMRPPGADRRSPPAGPGERAGPDHVRRELVEGPAAAGDDSIRVQVRLVEQADEISPTNSFSSGTGFGWTGGEEDARLDAGSARQLNLVTGVLQTEVMRLRLQRLAVLWVRLLIGWIASADVFRPIIADTLATEPRSFLPSSASAWIITVCPTESLSTSPFVYLRLKCAERMCRQD